MAHRSALQAHVATAVHPHHPLQMTLTHCLHLGLFQRQVEQMYNKLLDESDRFREDMGDITDNVSLETALETAWDDLESKTGEDWGVTAQALHTPRMPHSPERSGYLG